MNKGLQYGRVPCVAGCICKKHKGKTFVSLEATAERARGNTRSYYLKYQHGITAERWKELWERQQGLCYLCKEPLDADTKNVHVDHDHNCCSGQRSCGKCVRGLACQLCNQGIGQFKDDPDRMRKVADNLEKANDALKVMGYKTKN